MPGAHLGSDAWITEYISPHDVYLHGVVEVLAYRKTAFQQMYVVRSGIYGTALVLDGKWQSCTGDEFLYHESLVQPACVYHGAPKNVLILGGGEGATTREVLRWRTVERVVMVDIDGEVVAACKEHLPEMHQGAFDDPRTEVVIGDAIEYLDNALPEWDVIISDLSDPIEEGPSFKLFTREYFEQCRRGLRPGGVSCCRRVRSLPPRWRCTRGWPRPSARCLPMRRRTAPTCPPMLRPGASCSAVILRSIRARIRRRLTSCWRSKPPAACACSMGLPCWG